MIASLRSGHFSPEDIDILKKAGLEIITFQPDQEAEKPRSFLADLPSLKEKENEEIIIDVEI